MATEATLARKRLEEAMASIPNHDDRFLNDVCAAFRLRSKALSHMGEFEFEDTEEFVEFRLQSIFSVSILQCFRENRVSVFIRSRAKRIRGKFLLEIPKVTVICRGDLIVKCFEWMVDVSSDFPNGEPEITISKKIEQEWVKLTLRVVRG